jgi:microcystin degradation protein MlrC
MRVREGDEGTAMRYAVGTFSLECNSFSPEKTTLDYFAKNGYLVYGEAIRTHHRGMRNELAGFLDVCDRTGIEAVPTCAAWAIPHGVVERSAYDTVKRELLARIGQAGGVDGVYLCLHGSMIVDGLDDPEGDLLEAVRGRIGAAPLVASLDFHGNVTRRIATHADIVVGYNSFPHTNLFEVGQKAATLARRYHGRTADLRRIFIKIPMIVPMARMTIVGNEPMVRIIRELERLEGEDGMLALSAYGVQCWLDIDEMGCSLLGVVRNDRTEFAVRELSRLAREFWDLRRTFLDFPFYSPEAAIREGLTCPEQPIVLNEPADNVGAGSTGDSTYVLEALLKLNVTTPSILSIVDPEAVDAAVRAGVGNTLEMPIGGKLNQRFSRPIPVRGTVRTIFDGRYRYAGPMFHGVETSMGRTAVLEINSCIFVQLSELPVWTIDPEHYRCVGLVPERMKFIGVKSQGSFKAAYEGLAKRVLYLDTPGISGSNLRRLPFTKIDRECTYPWKEELAFEPAPLIF